MIMVGKPELLPRSSSFFLFNNFRKYTSIENHFQQEENGQENSSPAHSFYPHPHPHLCCLQVTPTTATSGSTLPAHAPCALWWRVGASDEPPVGTHRRPSSSRVSCPTRANAATASADSPDRVSGGGVRSSTGWKRVVGRRVNPFTRPDAVIHPRGQL